MNSTTTKIPALLAGCVRAGELQTETHSVELGAARSVRMHVNLGAGELTLASGSDALLNSKFTYNVAEWKPEVTYTVDAGSGDLTVRQPTKNGDDLNAQGDIRNEWDLKVNNSVPMSLDVNMGAGTSNLDLSKVALTGLNVNLGAGDADIDLPGALKHDLSAAITGGAGNTTLHLPKSYAVHVVAKNGIGSVSASGLTKSGDAYVNSAYGKGGPTLDISIKSGVGEIILDAQQ